MEKFKNVEVLHIQKKIGSKTSVIQYKSISVLM